MTKLPFHPPDAKCNARLARGGGYCEQPAGKGTPHPGRGRCRLHGGMSPEQDALDGPYDLMRNLGLGRVIDLAETMVREDQEYVMDVATNGLVIMRGMVVARMMDSEAPPSAKELADLTMALSRIDTALARHPDEEDPDAAANEASDLDEELARLLELES